MKRIEKIYTFSQSLWYDNIKRSLLDSGEIAKMIEEGEIVGITSNPTIFQKAIGGSEDYDGAIEKILQENPQTNVDQLYEKLVVRDIQDAADLLRGVYDKTACVDGYVSIEVSPRLAHNTEATIAEGKQLFALVNRPNVMIKVPATEEGLPAITALLAEGINVNVTLMFSLQDFLNVTEAYLTGIEKCAENGKDLSKVSSVASFFISRLDSAVDKILGEDSELKGKTAIAYAKMVYQCFQEMYKQERFTLLQKKGAQLQRLLWASTSTKNPTYRDVMYIEELIGENTVNTVPPATLDAFRDHGEARLSVTESIPEVHQTLAEVNAAGVNLDAVTKKLTEEGVAAFAASFDSLMKTLETKRNHILSKEASRANTTA